MTNLISTVGDGTYFTSNPGLLRRNSDIRDMMLSMNVGKYRLYDEALLPAIGETANVHEHTGNVSAYAFESDNGLVDYYKTEKMRGYYFNKYDGLTPELISFTQEKPNFGNETACSEDSLGTAKNISPWYNKDSGYLTQTILKDTTGDSVQPSGTLLVDNFFSDYKKRVLSNIRGDCFFERRANGWQIAYSMHPEVDGYYGTVGNISSDAVSGSGYQIEDGTTDGVKDIYAKTSQFFKDKKISSIINRFYASNQEPSQIQTAVSSFGISRGRNLLKKKATTHNGYLNPYCRVWTSHYQYGRTTDTIRPFSELDENGKGKFSSISEIQAKYGHFRPNDGAGRLEKFTVLQKNGLPRIAPSLSPQTIKKCMFSIENLAWKDLNLSAATKSINGEILGPTLTEEQIGPNGGRIMWFPPYDLSFSETSNPNWNSISAIGRGEKMYTYTDTERTGRLDFILLVDHPSVVDRLGKNNDAQGDRKEQLEQELLRFFAGCGNLTPDDSVGTELADTGESEEAAKTEEPTTTPKAAAKKKQYYCYIFFPNNFSGKNVSPEDAMKYLFAGMGISSERSDDSGKEAYDSLGRKQFPTGYEMSDAGISIFSGEKPSTQHPTDLYYKDDLKGMIANGKGQYWGYLVDNKYKTEILSGQTNTIMGSLNYADRKSFKLNSDKDVVSKQFKLGDDVRVISFKEFYEIVNNMNNTDALNSFKKQMGTDYEITVSGFASEHGHKKNNDSLHKNRAKTVMSWLSKFFETEKIGEGENETIDLSKGNDDVNLMESKAARCAKITILFDDSNVNVQDAVVSDIRMDRSGSLNTLDSSSNAQYVAASTEILSTGKLTKFMETSPKQISSDAGRARIVELQTKVTTGEDHAYDNEYLYFRDLKENDPMIYGKLTDKLKFFNPAFHSITPEGFNARLTFLHQCTRQGPTQSHSDGSGSASNLAFGRAPYCILRIGDFYNTRIAITSLSINYENSTWDMNPEGIGVQPMMAKVSIGFTFVGGSDLSGPISRLQNAVSFNFYGNTSVYDRRADYRDVEIFKESDGKGTDETGTATDSYYVWNPSKNVSGKGNNAGPQYKQYSVDYKRSYPL